MKRIARVLIMFLISLTIAAMTAWGVLAVYYSNLPVIEVRRIIAFVFAFFGATVLPWYVLSTKRHSPLLLFSVVFLLIYAWWSMIMPRQDRDWAIE
jgi:hypothetical protein